MLSGIGGVHHCLLPEPSELVIEAKAGGGYSYRCTSPAQSLHTMANLLGYQNYLPLLQAPTQEPPAKSKRNGGKLFSRNFLRPSNRPRKQESFTAAIALK